MKQSRKGALHAMTYAVMALMGPGVQVAAYYTLPQVIEQAQAGWRQTYQAHGREISVDVTPQMPEAEQFPVLCCSWKADWDLVSRSSDSDPLERYPLMLGGESFMVRIEEDGSRISLSKSPDPNNCPAGYAIIGGKKRTAHPYRAYYPPFDRDKAYIPMNPLTLGEMTDIVKKDMMLLGLDTSQLAREPRELGTHSFYDQDMEQPLAPGWGGAQWDQVFGGIPIIADVGGGWFFTGGISATFRERDFYDATFPVLKLERVIADDVPLCGLDRVIAALEEEILAGRLRTVFDIKLGYGVFNEDGVPEDYKKLPKVQRKYYLKPVWTIHAIWGKSAGASTDDRVYDDDFGHRDQRNSVHSELIIIDAQTGEMIKRPGEEKQSFKTSYYHGYLSWDDVVGRPAK
jgi:hypothetical protein